MYLGGFVLVVLLNLVISFPLFRWFNFIVVLILWQFHSFGWFCFVVLGFASIYNVAFSEFGLLGNL